MKPRFLQRSNIGLAISAAIAMALCSSARAQTTCFGIPDTDPSVCSGHGACTAPDTCACEVGYTGSACESFTCFGVPSTDPSVCSGNGTCVALDTCACEVGYSGSACEFFTCFGVPNTDPSVCSANGTCVALDTCACEVGFSGNQCQTAEPLVPTLSGWGVVALALLVLAGATVLIAKRRPASV